MWGIVAVYISVTRSLSSVLTIKKLITIAANDTLKYCLFFICFISIDISCEFSAKQKIQMKCQYLFSQKNFFLLCALRVNNYIGYNCNICILIKHKAALLNVS